MYDATGIRLHAGRQAEVRFYMWDELSYDQLYWHLRKKKHIRSCLIQSLIAGLFWYTVNNICIIHHMKLIYTLLLLSFHVQLLNQIVCELPPEHPLSNNRPLREPLGHTPLQVSYPSDVLYILLFLNDEFPFCLDDFFFFAIFTGVLLFHDLVSCRSRAYSSGFIHLH